MKTTMIASASMLLALCVYGQDTCNQYQNEASCESKYGCYWSTWNNATGNVCIRRPQVDSDCGCVLDECGGELSTEWRGPSGCEPVRFCVYKYGGCRVELDLTVDDSCREDGDRTGKCAPSEFCEPRSGAPVKDSYLLFTNSDCVLKPGITLYPTKSPVTKAPVSSKPTAAPTASPSAPTLEDSDGFPIIPVIAGTGAAVGVGLLIAGVLYKLASKSSDEIIAKEAIQRRKASIVADDQDDMPDF